MANRITNEQIELINLAYLQCRTYTGAAKAAGVSPSTAKKYIISNYQPAKTEINYSNIRPAATNEITPFTDFLSIYQATELSFAEKDAMVEFWKEINI